MARRIAKVLAALGLLVAGQAQAAQDINVSFTSSPLGDGSLVQWIMHMETPGPSQIGAIDLTINGNLNQISQVGLISVGKTPFMDKNAQIVQLATLQGLPISPAQDSQFLFLEEDVVTTPDLRDESPAFLYGSFAFQAGSNAEPFFSKDIAQIVLPAGEGGTFVGAIALFGGDEIPLSGSFGMSVVDPARAGIGAAGSGAADASLDASGPFQKVDLGGAQQGVVRINNWNNQNFHALYIDLDTEDGGLIDQVIDLLNSEGNVTAARGGQHGDGFFDIFVELNYLPGGAPQDFSFDLRELGVGVDAVAVPVPAAAWAGMALLAGLGVARRNRKD